MKLDLLKDVSTAQEAAPEVRRAALQQKYKQQYGDRWHEVMPKSLGGMYDANAQPSLVIHSRYHRSQPKPRRTRCLCGRLSRGRRWSLQ